MNTTYKQDIEDKWTHNQICAMYSYNPDTGNIRHKRIMRGIQHGSIAGSMVNGYINIKINNRLYRAHRIAWMIHHGEWPDGYIDHINMDKADNKISNLRLCNSSQNHANTQISKQNTTGHKNISRMTGGKTGWRIRITHQGKRYQWSRVRLDDAIELAKTKRVELFGSFAHHG